jgi:hypothetical protein
VFERVLEVHSCCPDIIGRALASKKSDLEFENLWDASKFTKLTICVLH